MICKNCGHEIVFDYFVNIWLHWHYSKKDSDGNETPEDGWFKCFCGCINPEPEKEVKK